MHEKGRETKKKYVFVPIFLKSYDGLQKSNEYRFKIEDPMIKLGNPNFAFKYKGDSATL